MMLTNDNDKSIIGNLIKKERGLAFIDRQTNIQLRHWLQRNAYFLFDGIFLFV